MQAWDSVRRIIAIIAGTQSGKTVYGPWWLLREIQSRGPGEYAVVSPTYAVMYRKLHQTFMEVFEPLGRYIGSPIPRFIVSREGAARLFGDPGASCVIFFCYAENSNSLESMTLKGVLADECGQEEFKRESWEALQRRCLRYQARICIGTTPYNWGWLKTDVYDRWLAGSERIDVINFETTMNPSIDQAEYDEAQATLPSWKFDMMYRGKFTRPAGQIYDCFEKGINTCKRFLIPRHWMRIKGTDFGDINTASVFAAIRPEDGKVFIYRSYHDACDSTDDTVAEWRKDLMYFESDHSVFSEDQPLKMTLDYGGAPSEDEWRARYAESGWPINKPPYADVQSGINRVYGLLKTGRLVIFDDLEKLISEIETYSREINEAGEPIQDKILNKARYHRADSVRYLANSVWTDYIPEQAKRGANGPAGKNYSHYQQDNPDIMSEDIDESVQNRITTLKRDVSWRNNGKKRS
jgi:hypothetical protein